MALPRTLAREDAASERLKVRQKALGSRMLNVRSWKVQTVSSDLRVPVLCVLCSRLVLVCRCQWLAVALFGLKQTRGFRKYGKVMKWLPYRNWSGAFAPLAARATNKVYLTLRLAFFFLGAFAKLRKATRSFVMSVCPSARMNQLGSHGTDFHEIWYLMILRTYM